MSLTITKLPKSWLGVSKVYHKHFWYLIFEMFETKVFLQSFGICLFTLFLYD